MPIPMPATRGNPARSVARATAANFVAKAVMAVAAVPVAAVIVVTPVARAIVVRGVAARRVGALVRAVARGPVAIAARVAMARAMNGVVETVVVRAVDAISAARGRSAISRRVFPCRSPSCPSARISA